jgi:hypothetical protein
MEPEVDNNLIKRSLTLALSVDPYEIRAYVSALQNRYPEWDRRALAEHMISRARWWGAGYGAATGAPSNPWIATPAALTDIGALLRTEILLACRIGVLFDPHLLDGPDPPYEVLVPILGARAGSEMLGRLAVHSGVGITREAIKAVLKTGSIRTARSVVLKYLGVRVTQRGILTKTLPLVGGVIGGAWNYAEVKIVGERVYRYFEKGGLSIEPVNTQ